MKVLFVRRLGALNFFDMLSIGFLVLLVGMIIRPTTVLESAVTLLALALAIIGLLVLSGMGEEKYEVER